MAKYPSDLSGGQKQRAVIARAIILNPLLLVADEPVSMLDMSVRAKILELMLHLKWDFGLTYLYITHDLATAKFFCDRIAILYLGRIVEIGPSAAIYEDPKHPYTKALLRAIPEPDPRKAFREICRAEKSPTPRGLRSGARSIRVARRRSRCAVGEARPSRLARNALGTGAGAVRGRAGGVGKRRISRRHGSRVPTRGTAREDRERGRSAPRPHSRRRS